MQTPLPPQCASKFRAEKLLASGGYGSVWLAHQKALDRQVAIKVLHGETLTDLDTVDRFLNEAKITASLNHPNIVKIIDHGVDGGVPWIAYEYVPGQSLRIPVQGGGLPWPDALRAAVQIASALHEAHSQGILHRDIKPDNVLEANKGHYKVADFGVAKWSADGAVKTQVGVILGTPAYLSPTQVAGQPPTPESDFYALGVLLYELLTGRAPLYDENLAELLRLHRSQPVPPPSGFTPTVPKNVDRIVLKLLAKKREDRYATGPELIADLDRALEGSPLAETKPPVGAAPQGSGTFRRGRGETRSVSGASSAAIQTRAVSAVAGAPVPAAGTRLRAFAVGALLAVGAIALLSRARVPPPPPVSPSPVAVVATPSPSPRPRVIVAPDGVEMVLVEGGPYTLEAVEENGTSLQKELRVEDFYMDRTEVTNRQYDQFLVATKRPLRGPAQDFPILTHRNHPVVRIDWREASEYLEWAGKRLPTEAEWQLAASGRMRNSYPWGATIDRESPQANYKDAAYLRDLRGQSVVAPLGIAFHGDDHFGASAPVGSFPQGASAAGILDLAGNVAEWCREEWPHAGAAKAGTVPKRVIRGGGWDEKDQVLYVNLRRGKPEDTHNRSIGCRGVIPALKVDGRFKPAR